MRAIGASVVMVILLLSGGPAGVAFSGSGEEAIQGEESSSLVGPGSSPVSEDVAPPEDWQGSAGDVDDRELARLQALMGAEVSEQSLSSCLQQDACSARLDWLLWTESMPVDALADALKAQIETPEPFGLPLPTQLPDHAGISEEDQREAWRAWYLVSLMDQASSHSLSQNPYGPFTASAMSEGSQGAQGSNESGGFDPAEGPGAARDLPGLWRLEGHGYPIEVMSGDTEGATFLVTSRGLMHFPAADDPPDWMVRPSSGVFQARPVFDSGGDVEKIVIGTMPSMTSQDPSILVVDSNGNRTWSGRSGVERLYYWELTDVDGDGEMEIIGLDGMGRHVALKLDGSVIYQETIEAPPSPGLVSPPLVPVYLQLYYLRQGFTLFGDFDGDDTLDILVPGSYRVWFSTLLLGDYYDVPLLQAYSGRDLELLWTYADPPSWFDMMFPVATGDLDGDGSDDVMVSTMTYLYVAAAPGLTRSGTIVISGNDATVLVRDEDYCAMTCVQIAESDYQPMALIDLDGDGTHEMLTVEETYDSDWNPASVDLVLRGPGEVDGVPSQQTGRHGIPLPDEGEFLGGEIALRHAPDGSDALWIHLYSLVEEEESRSIGSLHHLLDGSGLTSSEGGDGFGMVDQDPRTGQFYGWILESDRWVPLDNEFSAQGEGMRLVVSVSPMMFHDRSGDGVPDVLIPMSLGARWVSGMSGAHLEEMPTRLGNYPVATGTQDDKPVILEYDPFEEEYALYSLDGERHWGVDGDDVSVSSLADFTEDGRLDLLMRERDEFQISGDGFYQWIPGDYYLLTMPDEEKIWELSRDSGDSVVVSDFLSDRDGVEIVVSRSGESYYDLDLSLMVVGEEDPRWQYEKSGMRMRSAGSGIIVIAEPTSEHDDADRIEFLDARTGKILSKMVLQEPDEDDLYRSWTSMDLIDLTGNGTAELVYLYRDTDYNDDEPVYRQTARIVDPHGGATLAEFRLSDPQRIQIMDYWYSVSYNYLSAEMGDWDRDGLVDLGFIEQGRPVVRSSGGGEILAVGPKGGIGAAWDLNDDGRKEIALLQPARLRLLTYVPGSGLLDDDDDGTELLENPADVHHEEPGARGAFDDNRGLPAPAFGFVLLLVGAVLVLRRRGVGRE